MRDLKVAYGSSRTSVKWTNREISFRDLCMKLQHTQRTSESAEEYPQLPKEERDRIKDHGGLVGGHLRDGRRKADHVLCRSLGSADVDSPDKEFLTRYRAEHRFASVLYTTHSHTPEAPRYRIFIPFTRDVNSGEYMAIMRWFAKEIGIECVDPCTYRVHQLMYWPTTPSNGEYICEKFDGPWLDPDAFLAEHPGWEDISTLPTSSKESTLVRRDIRRQQDPLSKTGAIGAFNNVYFPIQKLLAEDLADVYEPTTVENRYTHIGSTGTAGAVIYEDRFLYSNHATDPAYGKLLNAFDLMRVHRFGNLSEKDSMTQALRYATGIPEVSEKLVQMKQEQNAADAAILEAEMPEPILLSSVLTPPEKPPELITGILRRGHKMLIAGPSKAGKSFLLIELAIAIAEGRPWLGFPCAQGKVLYVNLEIDPASCIDRFLQIYNRLGIKDRRDDNIFIWNLRGHALPLDKLAPIIIEKMKHETIAAVIVDPIYKVITGDENNASEMGAFCNQFDKICTAMGASAIYCHHHSKGSQGGKKAMDRASGSGVFARDPDAQLDIIGLKKPNPDDEIDEEEDIEEFDGNNSPWRMEAALREFPPIAPVNFWFEHPVHVVDSDGSLAAYYNEGSALANLALSSKRTSAATRRRRLDEAYAEVTKTGTATVRAMAEHAGLSTESIRRYLKEFSEDYTSTNGVVIAKAPLPEE